MASGANDIGIAFWIAVCESSWLYSTQLICRRWCDSDKMCSSRSFSVCTIKCDTFRNGSCKCLSFESAFKWHWTEKDVTSFFSFDFSIQERNRRSVISCYTQQILNGTEITGWVGWERKSLHRIREFICWDHQNVSHFHFVFERHRERTTFQPIEDYKNQWKWTEITKTTNWTESSINSRSRFKTRSSKKVWERLFL